MNAFTSRSALFLCLCAAAALADARTESAGELLRATSLDAVLRADAAESARAVELFPEEVPDPLRADLRVVLGKNLAYAQEYEAVQASVISRFDAATVDRHLRWWTSPSGRAIAQAESRAYAALRRGFPMPRSPAGPQADDASKTLVVREVMSEGKFQDWAKQLLDLAERTQRCLWAATHLEEECTGASVQPDEELLHTNVDATIRDSYLSVSAGDLASYRAYLRAADSASHLGTLRSSMLAVKTKRLTATLAEMSATTQRYAEQSFRTAGGRDSLAQITRDVDAAQQLERARVRLQLLRRADPRNPAVLVQLARVALKQSATSTTFERPGVPPPVDPAGLALAQHWIDKAIALDNRRADTWVLAGHLAYLKSEFRSSIEQLERARALGTSNPWLRINLAEALWSAYWQDQTRDLAERAMREFEAAVSDGLPANMDAWVAHQLSEIHKELGNTSKADDYYRRHVTLSEGKAKAFALHRYAWFLLTGARDVDASVRAARDAVELYAFPLGRQFLAQVLLVKSQALYRAGQPKEAAALVAEARVAMPDLEALCPDMARLRATLPGVFALRASGAVRRLSGRVGGETLLHASLHAGAADIEALLAWGADPSYFDPDEGTPLHRAILADNAPAVKTLLAHGADPTREFTDGRTTTEMADEPSLTHRAEILQLLRSASPRQPKSAPPAGAPLRAGYRYKVLKPIEGARNGHSVDVGAQLVFVRNCKYGHNDQLACFMFNHPTTPDVLMDVALEKTQLSSWSDWFEELGPAK